MKNSTRVAGLLVVCALAVSLSACGSAQSRKARYIQHGQEYYNAHNYDKARVEFRNAAQIDPKDAQVRYLLGQVAEKMGDVREALGQYQSAVNQDGKFAPARAALARLYVYGGLPDKAMSLVEPGLVSEPNNAQLLTVRGAAKQELGDKDGALKDAESAVHLAPNDDYAVALLASLYKQHGEAEQAIAVTQNALNQLPDNVDLRVILADLFVSQNQLPLAEAQLQKIVSLEPKVLVDRYRLAKFYLSQKNGDAAEKTLREAVATVPDSADAKLQLVEFLSSQRGRDEAVKQINQFIAQSPNDDALKLTLGQFLVQAGLNDQAESTFRSVIAHAGVKPNGLSARDRVAALELGRGNTQAASALVAEVLKENARDNDALILRANISLASANPTSAITDLRAVLRDQPNALPVMRALARAYSQNGEAEQAEETLRSAVQISPKDPESRLELAQVLTNAKKYDQAAPMLEQLAKDAPLNVNVEEALFRVQAAQQHHDEARATAQSIQKAHPNMALGYYLAGLVDEDDGKVQNAEQDYDQALKLQPQATEPLTSLVRLAVRGKHPEVAMQRVDAAIAAEPNNGAARTLKAELFSSEGQTNAALSAYQDAVKAAPNWVPAYRGLALVQVLNKNNDDAIRTLQDGLAKNPSSNQLVEDLAALYQRLNRPDDAIALYDGILTKNPNATFAQNNLAMMLVTYKTDAASLTRAQQLADQLASMSLGDVIDTRGWVKFKRGEFHEAETLLQQAVDKSPDAPEMRYHLAMAELRSGEQQIAQQNLETALSSARPFVGMDDARATLAQLKKTAAAG